MKSLWSVIVIAMTVPACGGDVPFANCEDTRLHVCEAACACGGDACRIQVNNVLFDHPDLDACLVLWQRNGCSMTDPMEDFGVCDAALESAACVMRTDGTMALVYPNDCTQ